MAGFYREKTNIRNPGRTQMRISFVESPERMKLVPRIFSALFRAYGQKQAQ